MKFQPLEAPDTADASHTPLGSMCIKLPKESRVTTKTRGVISPLGEIIAHDVSRSNAGPHGSDGSHTTLSLRL